MTSPEASRRPALPHPSNRAAPMLRRSVDRSALRGGPSVISRLVDVQLRAVTGMHGGVKFYRGSPAAARSYVEADRSRVDDYYLAEGTGLATLFVASPITSPSAREVGSLDGPAYERWVAGHHVETGQPKGRLRRDQHGLRFVEIVVNG